MTKRTPKEQVLRRWRVHVSYDCGQVCVGSERLGIIGVGETEEKAWADAARRLKGKR